MADDTPTLDPVPDDASIGTPPEDWGAAIFERLGINPDAPLAPSLTETDHAVAIDISKIPKVDTSDTVTPEESGESEPTQPETPASSEAPTVPSVGASETVVPSIDTDAGQATASASQSANGWDYTYLTNTGESAVAHFDDDQLTRALQVTAWVESLPDDLRNQFAAIEGGTHVAIERTEAEQFYAWREQQYASQRDADLDKLDADPDTLALLKQQRDQIEYLQSQSPTADTPPNYVNQFANYSQSAAAFDTAAQTYAQYRHLEPDEMRGLYHTTVNSGIIRHLASQYAQYSPTGVLIAPADPARVLYEALDYHLTRDPALHTAVITRTSTPSTPAAPDISTVPPATEHSDATVAQKRARASSMSAAPSAAVTPAPRNVAEMSDAEIVAAMEADLAPLMRDE